MRALTIAAVTVGAALALGGCGAGSDEVNGGMIGTPAPTTATAPTTTAPTTAAPATTAARPAENGTGTPTARCTDRTNYAGDPRSDAEINAAGERTGTCPAVRTSAPGTVPYDPQVSCTDRVNYAGDPRSNAEIDSIGERTGTCPAVQR